MSRGYVMPTKCCQKRVHYCHGVAIFEVDVSLDRAKDHKNGAEAFTIFLSDSDVVAIHDHQDKALRKVQEKANGERYYEELC